MKLRLVSLVLLVGCAKQTSGTIGQAESVYAGQALAAGVEDGATAFGPVNAGAGVDASCVTLSGDVTDPDSDTIPTNATVTFNCSATSLGYTGLLTGTETVMDTEPQLAAWAFSADADLKATLTAPSNATLTTARVGQLLATQASPLGPYQLARMLDVTTTFHARETSTVFETNQWTVTYTPQASWTPGGVAVTGSVTLTGSWDVTVGSNAANATLATPTPLTLSPACATRITAGTVTGSYDGGGHGNTISVTWTGCGTSTVTYAPH
jgi:hypothetical protein